MAWPLLAGLLVATLGQWFWSSRPGLALRARLYLTASHRWGAYHDLERGALWDRGEVEVYRVPVTAVSVAEGGQHSIVHRHSICVLTNHRLVLCDPRGHLVQIPFAAIRSVHVFRDVDPWHGSDYWVAIGRQGSYAHAQLGDIAIRCDTNRAGHELAEHIQSAITHPAAG